MPVKGYFVTGTGTGVGKTFVTCALARCARAMGKRVFAFKPVETGCSRVAGRLVGSDQELVCAAAGNWQTHELRGLYQFEPPVAPWVAAEHEGVEIDLAAIRRTVEAGGAGADLVLVEGAGGWRVPITATTDMAELARQLGFAVIVVGQATLGTINHSLLSVEAIERDGGSIAALVLSRLPGDDEPHVIDNARRIASRWQGQVIVCSTERDVAGLA
jgi:dethiobiotin synthetase